MTKFIFVGEKRSQKAISLKVTWINGKLSAKQLFDALIYCNIDHLKQNYINWFADNSERRKPGTKDICLNFKGKVVALGQKVSKELNKYDIEHLTLVHPAARGKIRKKEIYNNHVRKVIHG